MDRMLFVNLPVRDLGRTRAFWAGLGFAFDDRFSNDDCVCLRINDQTYAMLLTTGFFATMTGRQPLDAGDRAEVVLALSAPSRDGVDELVDGALGAGAQPAGDAEDQGFMYGRPFADPDGHLWNVVWMDVEAAMSTGHVG